MRTRKRTQEAEKLCTARLEAMKVANGIDGYEELEASDTALRDSDVLAISKRVSFDVELSWGGPADRLRFYMEGYELVDVEYHYSDWFYHQEVSLDAEQKQLMLDWAEHVLDLANYDRWK